MAQSANAIRARPNFRQCYRLPGSAAPCRKTWQKRGWGETVSGPPRPLQRGTIEAQHQALRLGRRSAVRRQAQEKVVVRQREFSREPGSALGNGLLIAASQQPRAVATVRPVDVASTVGQPFGQQCPMTSRRGAPEAMLIPVIGLRMIWSPFIQRMGMLKVEPCRIVRSLFVAISEHRP